MLLFLKADKRKKIWNSQKSKQSEEIQQETLILGTHCVQWECMTFSSTVVQEAKQPQGKNAKSFSQISTIFSEEQW